MKLPIPKNELRIQVFNRTLEEKYKKDPQKYELLKEIINLNDEEKLAILDAAALPNGIDINSIKYGLFFHYIFADSQRFNELNSFIAYTVNVSSTLTRLEKEIIRYGYIYGFKYKDPLDNYQEFIRTKLNGEKTDKLKKVTLYAFKKVFNFIYKILKKGELNEQFPTK